MLELGRFLARQVDLLSPTTQQQRRKLSRIIPTMETQALVPAVAAAPAVAVEG